MIRLRTQNMLRAERNIIPGDLNEATDNFTFNEDLAAEDLAAIIGNERAVEIISDFQSPYLELIRLLRESAEIEHALMVQYLYAAFSIRSTYGGIIGPATGHGDGLLPVAIQEMEHLHDVCELLTTLDAAPNLVSQSFPFDTDIYPFSLNLERLSLKSLAKYVFTEAAAEAITPSPDENDPFLTMLYAELGELRPNHLGSVYARIIELAEQVQASPPFQLPDLTIHIGKLRHIKNQGEDAHFNFFKSVFLGEHPGFNDNNQVWQLPPGDADYPSFPVLTNPSGYEGHQNQIPDPDLRKTAMLGNLHYWIILALLDLSYRHNNSMYLGIAISNHMTGPLMSLGQFLAQNGVGVPFDQSNLGSSAGRDETANARIVKMIGLEAQNLTEQLRTVIGTDEADNQIFALQDTIDSLST